MTREDIIRMAFEALGAPYSSYLGKRSWDISDKQVERFAALVIASSRKPLTEQQIMEIEKRVHFHESLDWPIRFARELERAHGIGGGE